MEESPTPNDARKGVEDLLTRLFVAMDEARWAEVSECFTDKVLLDLSSSGAGKPSRTTRAKVVETLSGRQKGLESVHRQTGNVLAEVGENEASAFCYCTESQYFPNPTGESVYTTIGSYDFHLSADPGGWKIDALRFKLKFAYGNPVLPEIARKAHRKGGDSKEES